MRGRLAVPVTGSDHSQGPPDAAYVLVQYGDYECPHTRRSLRDVQMVQSDLGAELLWVFRNFPLTKIHPHALRAAEAAEAAGALGRFWEMHATLFRHQEALERENLHRYAAEIGLDAEAFTAELESGLHLDRILADFDGGVRSGVNGTPAFFTNGLRHGGSYSGPELISALRASATPH